MTNIGDPVPETPWIDNVPRLPFCYSESVKLDSSGGLAKLKEINNMAP